MQVSVVIVNYNVKYFLEQCLYSVKKALQNISGEIIVVDNQSTDGSIEYLKPKFPEINFITNQQNLGFAKACNLGFLKSKGEFILFLNPDTIIPENCFEKSIEYFKKNNKAGALGVKMIDGGGRFLKESKRAFPSALTSFFKLIGLSSLFPHSKFFAKYHLGYLNKNKINEVDVLSGAFMLIKREAFLKTGGFDESFFMYGEDVDLSYRIQKAGYKNIYFPEITILHFKGESTKRGSLNYVLMFYKAMGLFVQKHFNGPKEKLFRVVITFGIWLRAILSGTGHLLLKLGLPVLDAGLILISFISSKFFWSRWVRPDIIYNTNEMYIAFTGYTIIFLTAAFFAGLYDFGFKQSKLNNSVIIASSVLLSVYALLPESLRFSRGIILAGILQALIILSLFRRFLIYTEWLQIEGSGVQNKTLIAASENEFIQAMNIISISGENEKILGRLSVNEKDLAPSFGYYKNLISINNSIPFQEIIFCAGNLQYAEIISLIQNDKPNYHKKIFADGSESIVGSNSKNSTGKSLTYKNGYKLSNPYLKRSKRAIDIMISILGFLLFPITAIYFKNKSNFFSNCYQVLIRKKTWVGYANNKNNLPLLPTAVLASNGLPLAKTVQLSAESIRALDEWYANEYSTEFDFSLLFKNINKLDK